MKRTAMLGLAVLLSGLLFLLAASLLQFVIANYISSKPAWPDEQSLSWRASENIFSTSVYLVPLAMGAVLSWASLRTIHTKALLYWAVLTAVTCAIIFSIGGRMELADDPRLSIGLLLAWPVFVLVISALGIHYASKRAGI